MVNFNGRDEPKQASVYKYHLRRRTHHLVGKAIKRPILSLGAVWARLIDRLDYEADKRAAIARGEMLAFRHRGGR